MDLVLSLDLIFFNCYFFLGGQFVVVEAVFCFVSGVVHW